MTNDIELTITELQAAAAATSPIYAAFLAGAEAAEAAEATLTGG